MATENYSKGLAYEWVDKQKNICKVVGLGTCTDTHLIIPDRAYDWLQDSPTVISIGGSLGFFGSSATALTIPDTVTSIEDSALSAMYFLEHVYFGTNLTTIGDYAFVECTSLTGVKLPDSVTSIGEGAFSTCSNLVEVRIGPNVATIGDYAFESTSRFLDIHIAQEENSSLGASWGNTNAHVHWNSDTSIGLEYELNSDNTYTVTGIGTCTNTDLVIPTVYKQQNVTTIGQTAFAANRSIQSVCMSSNITTIERRAFYSSGLTGVTLPSSVKTLGSEIFMSCEDLTDVIISEGCTVVGSGMFNDCAMLNNVTLPSTLTTIQESAFHACRSLTSIEIPQNTTLIEHHAFTDSCLADITLNSTNLSVEADAFLVDPLSSVLARYVRCTGGAEAWCNITFENAGANPLYRDDLANGSSTLYFPGKLEEWERVSAFNIPNGETYIHDNMLYGCSSVTSLTVPSTVVTIGSEAFAGCTQLQKITLDHPVNSIEGAVWGAPENVQIAWIGSVGSENVEFYFLNDANTPCPAQGAISFGVKEDKGRLYITYNGKSYLVGESVDNLKVNDKLDVSKITSTNKEISFDADTKVTFGHDTVVNGEFSANTTSVVDLSVTHDADITGSLVVTDSATFETDVSMESDLTVMGDIKAVASVMAPVIQAPYDASDSQDGPEYHTVVVQSPIDVSYSATFETDVSMESDLTVDKTLSAGSLRTGSLQASHIFGYSRSTDSSAGLSIYDSGGIDIGPNVDVSYDHRSIIGDGEDSLTTGLYSVVLRVRSHIAPIHMLIYVSDNIIQNSMNIYPIPGISTEALWVKDDSTNGVLALQHVVSSNEHPILDSILNDDYEAGSVWNPPESSRCYVTHIQKIFGVFYAE